MPMQKVGGFFGGVSMRLSKYRGRVAIIDAHAKGRRFFGGCLNETVQISRQGAKRPRREIQAFVLIVSTETCPYTATRNKAATQKNQIFFEVFLKKDSLKYLKKE